jgi:hypothetical protein
MPHFVHIYVEISDVTELRTLVGVERPYCSSEQLVDSSIIETWYFSWYLLRELFQSIDLFEFYFLIDS